MGSIDPDVERVTREMLDAAIRGEITALAARVESIGGERYGQVLGLCLTAAAYVAVDVSGGWPTEADVRDISRIVAEHEKAIELSEGDVRAYLTFAALGFRPLEEAMGSVQKAASLPLSITGGLLSRFRPEGSSWEDYLGQIWTATRAAAGTDLSVLPALLVRDRQAAASDERKSFPRVTAFLPPLA
jgi:hypothetical protein